MTRAEEIWAAWKAAGRMEPDGSHSMSSGEIEEFFEKYPDAAQYLVPQRSLREQQRAALKASAEWHRETLARHEAWKAEERQRHMEETFRALPRHNGVIWLEAAAAFAEKFPEYREALPLNLWAEFEASIAALRKDPRRPGARRLGGLTSAEERLLRGS